MWWGLSLFCAYFAHAHIARYISGLRDSMCVEEKKSRPMLAACDVSKNTQLIETLDASITKIQFDSGRCLSAKGDLVECAQAATFELTPYVWSMKVYLRISVYNTTINTTTAPLTPSLTTNATTEMCLTNPKLTVEPCMPYPLDNRSQLFIAFELGAHENNSELTTKDADWAFQQTNFLSFNLQYSVAQQKAQMTINPLSEAYLPAVITVQYGSNESMRYEGVGVRYKGSLGSFGLCIDPITKQINDVCRKLSLKVDTNKFIKKMKQNIFGLKKLIFNGMAIDYSLMAERVAFKAFQTVGVIAPRAVHASIYLNNNLSGVYIWIEAVDDVFTVKHFADDNNKGKGGLYKDAWLRGTRPGDYSLAWASGVDEDDFLAEAARAVFAARDDEAVSVLEKYFDTESIVSVTAMNAILGMTDDWRWRHNFWWYVRDYSLPNARNKKLVMLPWDYDRTNDDSWLERVKQGPWSDVWDPNDPRCSTAGGLSNSSNSSNTSYSNSNLIMLNATNDTSTQWFWSVINLMLPPDYYVPIQCDKLTRLFALALKKRVQARTAQYADVVTMDRIKSWMDDWSTQIQPVVIKENGKPTLEQWTLAKAGLLFHYMTARAVAGYEKVGALTGGLNSLGLSLETLIRETGGDLQKLISLGQAKATPPSTSQQPTLPTNRPTLAPFRLTAPTSSAPFFVPSSTTTTAGTGTTAAIAATTASTTASAFSSSTVSSSSSPPPTSFSFPAPPTPILSSPTLPNFFAPTLPAVSSPTVRPYSPPSSALLPSPTSSAFFSSTFNKTSSAFSSPTPLSFPSFTSSVFFPPPSSALSSPTSSAFSSPTSPIFSSPTSPVFSSPSTSSALSSPTSPAFSSLSTSPVLSSPTPPTFSSTAFSSSTPAFSSSFTSSSFSAPTPLTFSSAAFSSPTSPPIFSSSPLSAFSPPTPSLFSLSTAASSSTSLLTLPSVWLPPTSPTTQASRPPTPISFPALVAPPNMVTPVISQLFLVQPAPDFHVSGPIIVPAGTSLAALSLLQPGFQGPLPFNASSPFVSGPSPFNFPSSTPMIPG